MLGSGPDLLRLLAVPIFGWAAYRDVRTRRVPNRTWYPLVAIAVVALAWEALLVASDPLEPNRLYALKVALSVGILIPFAYGFWWVGGFGGADAKALMVLAVLFPTFPTYYLPWASLPLTPTTAGIFSLTILSNTVVAGLGYPLVLAGRNLLAGAVGRAMFVGRPIRPSDAPEEYGRLLETPDGFTRGGLDLDALRMYLQWRDVDLESVLMDPERYSDPESVPASPNPPGDGSIASADGGAVAESAGTREEVDPDGDDRWGAEAFLADIDHSAYGTSPEELRDGLEVLVSDEEVWLSPGIPFVVPMFFGLLVSLVYGDVLFAVLSAFGL